jgi:ferric-dicitrate binding protein FerR (iron transport regulator)
MAGSNTHIRSIINKYIAGEHTPEEFKQLLTYLSQSNIDDFDEEAWLVWERILQNKYRPDDEEARMSGLKAMQIIRQQLAETKTDPAEKSTIIRFVMRIAAAIALLLAISISGYLLLPLKNETKINFESIKADKGQKKEMQLVDGSAIHLNSESSITYPDHFYGNTREVTLSGEGFFEIAHDSLHAFVVNTSGIKVTVLGTTFNIKNYETDAELTITVATGKVKVMSADSMIYLLSNEQLIISKITGEIKKEQVHADKYSLWCKGMLFFDHTPITEAVETLERWYNIDICFNSDDKLLISGEHDNKSLQAVLEAICFTTGLKIKNESNCITLH